jgi:hypothetical protein
MVRHKHVIWYLKGCKVMQMGNKKSLVLIDRFWYQGQDQPRDYLIISWLIRFNHVGFFRDQSHKMPGIIGFRVSCHRKEKQAARGAGCVSCQASR